MRLSPRWRERSTYFADRLNLNSLIDSACETLKHPDRSNVVGILCCFDHSGCRREGHWLSCFNSKKRIDSDRETLERSTSKSGYWPK